MDALHDGKTGYSFSLISIKNKDYVIMFNGSSPVILFIYNFQRDMSSSYQHGMRMGKMPKNASKMLSLKLVSRLLISRHIKETIFTTLEP